MNFTSKNSLRCWKFWTLNRSTCDVHYFADILECALEKHRHLISATPPPSPTHGESGSTRKRASVQLFTDSPLKYGNISLCIILPKSSRPAQTLQILRYYIILSVCHTCWWKKSFMALFLNEFKQVIFVLLYQVPVQKGH